jgi:hypothetical protein
MSEKKKGKERKRKKDSERIGRINLTFLPSKKLYNVAISVSIPYSCDWYSLKLLNSNLESYYHGEEKEEKCMHIMFDGVEKSALAFAMFNRIRMKLIGSPLDTIKYKVNDLSCNVHGNQFVICYTTQGSITAIRKTIGDIVSYLTSAGLYSRYSHLIRFLGGQPNEEEFNYCANEIVNAVKNGVGICIIGKSAGLTERKEEKEARQLRANAEALTTLANAIRSKLPGKPKPSKKGMRKPERLNPYQHSYPFVETSNLLEAIIVGDYIENKLGVRIDVHNSMVVIYSGIFDRKRDDLKRADTIRDYIKKYDKLGAELPATLGYLGIMHHCIGCNTINTLIRSGITTSKMIEIIRKSL